MSELTENAAKWVRVRLLVAAALFGLLLLAGLARAVHLQVFQSDELSGMAGDQYRREVALKPRRGSIVDARGLPLAVSVDTDSVFLSPRELVTNPDEPGYVTARALAKALALEPELVKHRMRNKGTFVWLKRRISPQESAAVKKIGAKGVGLVREYRRFYPQKQLGAHVVGAVNIDGEGVDGVELVQDAALKGSVREIEAWRDAKGAILPDEDVAPASALAGATLDLTIDSAIQVSTEEALAAGVATTKSKSGVAIVMDPHTGAILALANSPTFNPNAPVDAASMRNRAVNDTWEPGSTMKCFTFSAALSEGIVTPGTPLEVGDGRLQFGRKAIKDSHHPEKPVLSATEVLATSSNVGTSRVGLLLGSDRLVSWFRAFGFGEKTGAGMPGEPAGRLQVPRKMGDIATATTSFGQGMTASPLQLVTALSAIANGGHLMRPYVLKRVTQSDGTVTSDRQPEVVRDVLKPGVARTITQMMIAVTEKGGTGTRASIPGVRIAGKTGTAQKVDPSRGVYGEDKFVSFMGFLPADDPKIAIYVGLDEPDRKLQGGGAAGPVFKQIAIDTLRQMGLTPGLSGMALDEAVARTKDDEPGDSAFFDDAPAALASDALVVPDLKGLSARAALRILTERRLEAEIEGSGRAVRQRPEAGASVQAGARVRVVLEAG